MTDGNTLRIVVGQFGNLIEQFHDRGNRSIKGVAATIVIVNLVNGFMGFTAQALLVIAVICCIQWRDSALCQMGMDHIPKLAQETMGTRYAIIAPFQCLLWRRSKHGEQTHRIGTMFINGSLWIDTIIFRFRHFGDTTAVHYFTSCGLSCLNGAAFFITLNGDIQGRQPFFAPPIVFIKRLR